MKNSQINEMHFCQTAEKAELICDINEHFDAVSRKYSR